MAFYTMLNELIINTGYSKNKFISGTGIDRSSFFKILSGKRLPTEKQLGIIIREICALSEKENISVRKNIDECLKEYLSEKYPGEWFETWMSVRSFLEASSGSGSAAENTGNREDSASAAVRSFILREMESQNSTLDFYLSPELIESFGIYSLLAGHRGKGSGIRQLVGAYEDMPRTLTSYYLQNLGVLIRLLGRGIKDFEIYYTEDSRRGKENQLFPYYILGRSSALIISSDGTRHILTESPKHVSAIKEQFENIINNRQPLFISYTNYAAFAQMLFKRYMNFGDNSMIFVSDRPCALQLITPELIDKYIHDPVFAAFSKSYTGALQNIKNFCGMMSPEGIAAFEKDRTIAESGMNFHLDSSDMAVINSRLDSMRGTRMLTVPFGNFFIPGWEIAVYDYDEALFSLHDCTDCVLQFKNKDIVRALYLFYDEARKILSQ